MSNVSPYQTHSIPTLKHEGTEKKTLEALEPIYKDRRETVKAIPNLKFWPVAFMHDQELAVHATHVQDQYALAHLEDIWVERDPKECRAFTIEFVSILPAKFTQCHPR